jgi:hypothetical protein
MPAIQMTPETELVVALCRTPLEASDRARASFLLSRPLDWERIFSLAETGQVEAVTLTNLVSIDDGQLPQRISIEASVRAREARAIALSRTLAMNELLAIFAANRLPVIVVKGPALGVTAYGDPSMRSFADIDLLVKHEDLVSSRDLLLANGYTREYLPDDEANLITNGHALEFSGRPIKVELHESLLSHYLRVQFDADEIWSSSRGIMCAGREIQVLAPEIQFLFLCAHGAKHEWMQLRWICDIAQLLRVMRSVEKDRVIELAVRLHAKRLLAVASQLVFEVFGENPELSSRGHGPGIGRMRKRVDYVLERIGIQEPAGPRELAWSMKLHPSLPALTFWIASRERMRDQIGCALNVLLVPTGRNRKGLTSYVRRPARLLVRALRRLATS